MYDQFYRFKAEPFLLSPDHAFAYVHKGYSKARAYMAFAFMRQEGFVMITGRPGTGKTTLIGALVEHLSGEDVRVANLVCSQLKADDLLKMVAYEFGVSLDYVEKGEILQRLTQQLRAWHRDGLRALLIVDEAQDLAISAMEELRLLTNIQVNGKPLLQIFLLGQPELRELVLRPELEQVHQRIVAACHLRPLALEETQAYILHRLDVVGWRGDPAFSHAVFPLVHKFSEGIPRRINLICSRLLLHCALDERHRVTVDDVREVVGELQDESLAVGTSWSESDFQLAQDPDIDVVPLSTGTPAPDGPEVTESRGGPRPAESPASESSVVSEPPLRGVADSVTHDDPAARDRQHLKVVATAPAQRRTGTDDTALERGQTAAPEAGMLVAESAAQPVSVMANGRERPPAVGSDPAARNRKEVAAASPGRAKPPAAGESRSGGGAGSERSLRESSPREGVPRARSGRAGPVPVRDSSGTWAILVILVFSASLVMWAATGFSLGFLGK